MQNVPGKPQELGFVQFLAHIDSNQTRNIRILKLFNNLSDFLFLMLARKQDWITYEIFVKFKINQTCEQLRIWSEVYHNGTVTLFFFPATFCTKGEKLEENDKQGSREYIRVLLSFL